jgi:aminoglycoside phosphotransferase family enzyme/predicted kinase
MRDAVDTTQAEVIAFLSTPVAFGQPEGQPVERVETHSAIVFLCGDRAVKLKRAVRYSYLDFSTLDRRKRACEDEVAVNRRTAPSLYRGVVPVTRTDDQGLTLNGTGAVVEWCVDMTRFDERQVLDRMASAGTLDIALMDGLARAVATFHIGAAREDAFGGYDGIVRVIQGNAAGFEQFGPGILDAAPCARLTQRTMEAAAHLRDRLERRRHDGFVRRCHGDLHLRNLVALNDQVTLFDGVEFNDDLSCIDVWYDTAFLLMDLVRRGLWLHANAVLNGYLARTEDVEGLPLLPLFLSCRAGVRAMTSATAASLQEHGDKRRELEELSREYLRLAGQLLAPAPARLVAVGGLSGSGKSTLARALAPHVGPAPGAVLLRSDEIRKGLAGVDAHTRLGTEGYTAAMTAQVYDTMARRARLVLDMGHAVIADAVFARPADRAHIEEVAHGARCVFTGLWLTAEPEDLRRRLQARGPDASDADVSVLEQQLAAPTGSIDWHLIDARQHRSAVLHQARERLEPAAAAPGTTASPRTPAD